MLKDILTEDMLKKGRFWTDAWSLVDGCTPVSPGCAHCWLAGIEKRFSAGMSGFLNDKGTFNGHVEERPERLDIPLHKRKPRVFAPWSDLGHEKVSQTFIFSALGRMNASKQHTFLIVTKRPERFVEIDAMARKSNEGFRVKSTWPLLNVIILVTMENQAMADKRLPDAVKLSMMGWNVGALVEPMLGPISLYQDWGHLGENGPLDALKWVICGPESGPGKRPFNPEWALSLREQAKIANAPYYYKKGELEGRYYLEVPEI